MLRKIVTGNIPGNNVINYKSCINAIYHFWSCDQMNVSEWSGAPSTHVYIHTHIYMCTRVLIHSNKLYMCSKLVCDCKFSNIEKIEAAFLSPIGSWLPSSPAGILCWICFDLGSHTNVASLSLNVIRRINKLQRIKY